MELRDCKAGEFAWWKYKDGKRILVRIRYVQRDYVNVFVAAATAEEVLESGRNIGESFATSALALEAAPGN